jgi:hypothetical protein
MATMLRPIKVPGQVVVEQEELDELDAPTEAAEEEQFEVELEQIASAEREAATEADLIHLCR